MYSVTINPFERHIMKSFLLSLVFVGTVFGRPLYVIAADPNSCGPQMDYTQTLMRHAAVNPLPPADPNMPYGAILGPVPNDPNTWQAPAGDFKRDWGRCCDPDGDPISIEFLGGTSPAVPQIDYTAGKWSFAATLYEGWNLFRFRAYDGKGERIVTVAIWGIKNEPAVLE